MLMPAGVVSGTPAVETICTAGYHDAVGPVVVVIAGVADFVHTLAAHALLARNAASAGAGARARGPTLDWKIRPSPMARDIPAMGVLHISAARVVISVIAGSGAALPSSYSSSAASR